MLPYPDIQTYLPSPQLRVLSIDLMGASPSSIPPEICQSVCPVVILMPVGINPYYVSKSGVIDNIIYSLH